ncbi:cadherin 17 [Rhinolophus ferrumequinum]|uniref:Cadherin-17 n=1 Tax=Rhinolophus ferrumequinum TaxID=59479 RepID=A0A671EYP7_RHIFE|nr:cadherin 17 [Rhinolophus ferrumequinum]
MMVQVQLHCLCLFTLYLTTGYGQEGRFSGPLKPMTFSIFEGQEESQIIFQFKSSPPAVTFKLSGETDGIFHIQDGLLYHSRALDRETRAVHKLQVSALDAYGATVEGPVPITIEVKDINDNRPVFLQSKYEGSVRQNSRPGSNIGTLVAHDMDEANTINSVLEYRIVDQTPKSPREGLFLVQAYTGVFQLALYSLKKQDTPQYQLTVEVSDKDFKTLCHVQINVIDINDQIPIFEKSDYGNLTLAEDTVVGSIILVIQATDADEPFTGSSKILYRITQGDSEGRLGIDTDPQTNTGYVMIKKPLDFETAAIHNIVFQAENPEPLVPGVEYNASSFATFNLFVTDVNEAPRFSQQVFQAKVSEDVAIGTKVGNVTAKDPEGLDISYSLRGDMRGWLKIDPVTGEIFSVAPLDREAESLYRVQVVATEVGGSSLSSIASFHLTLTDVNDNPPRLVKEYTGLLFCYPLREAGSLIFEATDDDQQSLQGPHFTFSLGSESLQNDWEVSKINGTHARLSTKHTGFEERVYNIPILINDGGQPPLEGTVSLPGMILAVVFIQMKNKGRDNVENAQASEVKPLRN